jgi:hypothetical protein
MELRNFKARITERLVEEYIDEVSIPRLRKGGFDLVFFDRTVRNLFPIPLDIGTKTALISGPKNADLEGVYDKLIDSHPEYKLHPEYRSIDDWKKTAVDKCVRIFHKMCEVYLSKGVYPDTKLLDRTLTLLIGLEVATDGLLFKLNKTGKTKSKRTLSNLFQSREAWTNSGFKRIEKDELPEDIPIVTGNIEIVEVKADKAILAPNQAKNYCNAIKNGYPLRYFHVIIISFEDNHFEVKEKLVNDINDFEHLLNSKRHKQLIP